MGTNFIKCEFDLNLAKKYTDKVHKYRCQGINYMYCIPYNEETKHLVSTNEQWEK